MKYGKTILFYINTITHGGAEQSLLSLAQEFSRAGFRSVVITSFRDKAEEYAVPQGVERVSIEEEERRDSFFMRNVRRIHALRKLCKQYAPVALVSFMAEANFRAILATVGLPIKVIISVRTDPARKYIGAIGCIANLLFPYADGCVFQTQSAMLKFPKKLQLKSKVIPNIVRDVFFEKRRSDKPKNLVAIGRLEKPKNFHLLIEAFARIENRHPQERLLIYGEGALRESLETQISNLKLESRVQLMGFTDDVPGVLAEAKMFVMSSDWEGMPNALLEAMAVGLPVVATDCPCGAPRMIIRDGENGLLVPVGDADKLSVAMDRILSDFSYARKIGTQAKQDIRTSLHADHIFSQWEEYISYILGKGTVGIVCGG